MLHRAEGAVIHVSSYPKLSASSDDGRVGCIVIWGFFCWRRVDKRPVIHQTRDWSGCRLLIRPASTRPGDVLTPNGPRLKSYGFPTALLSSDRLDGGWWGPVNRLVLGPTLDHNGCQGFGSALRNSGATFADELLHLLVRRSGGIGSRSTGSASAGSSSLGRSLQNGFFLVRTSSASIIYGIGGKISAGRIEWMMGKKKERNRIKHWSIFVWGYTSNGSLHTTLSTMRNITVYGGGVEIRYGTLGVNP